MITPLIADYTRKSIAAFVEKYPNVGLMVTLGEAMEGVGARKWNGLQTQLFLVYRMD